MSESSQHLTLVEALAREISGDSEWPNQPIIYCDIVNEIGTSNLPPIIGNNRPDVFARDINGSFSIIGEAKTAGDIDNNHTFSQLESFFDYLRVQTRSELWMAVPWLNAGTAMRVRSKNSCMATCRFTKPWMMRECEVPEIIIQKSSQTSGSGLPMNTLIPS